MKRNNNSSALVCLVVITFVLCSNTRVEGSEGNSSRSVMIRERGYGNSTGDVAELLLLVDIPRSRLLRESGQVNSLRFTPYGDQYACSPCLRANHGNAPLKPTRCPSGVDLSKSTGCRTGGL